MLKPKRSSLFKHDVERLERRKYDLAKLKAIVDLLIHESTLPAHCRDHALRGKLSGFRDCHIESDWVLIYSVQEGALYLYRTGTHADILE